MSDEPHTRQKQSFYVSTLRVRRELIPVIGDPKAWRCMTVRADGPEPGDQHVDDQVAFEDILIDMKLMPKRNPIRWAYAKVWRGLHADQLSKKRPLGSEPTEVTLRVID